MELSDQIKARLERKTVQGLLYPELSWEIVAAAIEVHTHIGPGQLESVYQRSMELELRRRRLGFRAQVPLPMYFKGDRVGDFFADIVSAVRTRGAVTRPTLSLAAADRPAEP